MVGVVRSDEVYRLVELKRRLGWRDHAVRQARRAGLQFVRFGRERFVLGSDVVQFFRSLAEQQNGTAPGTNGEAGE